ncbi:MAG: hypothetical protein M0R48_01790 [Candidatus Omnitrophica bacterium]|jgi:hypothetical protein|nr:hypothetical protein [Candidatus Omnitrophota bacterium]
MVKVKGANADEMAAGLRSIVLELEILLQAIEKNDTVVDGYFEENLKKIGSTINILRRRFQERRFV